MQPTQLCPDFLLCVSGNVLGMGHACERVRPEPYCHNTYSWAGAMGRA